MEQTTSYSYAGFWKRFAAMLIDNILLSIVYFLIFTPLLGLVGLGAASQEYESEAAAGLLAALFGTYLVTAIVLIMLAGWLYFALMESSSRGATLGKLALGIRVTDLNGSRISFGRATGRYFGKIVSGMILHIGFLMAGFTQQKQALHDIIAGCLVINSR